MARTIQADATSVRIYSLVEQHRGKHLEAELALLPDISFVGSEIPLPAEIIEVAGFAICLNKRADILLLPLSLDNFMSLRIAESVHRQQLNVRMILVTGSFQATENSTVPFFDYFVSTRSPNLMEAVTSAAANPTPRRLSHVEIDKYVSSMLAEEACFITSVTGRLRGSHRDLAVPSRVTLKQYRQGTRGAARAGAGNDESLSAVVKKLDSYVQAANNDDAKRNLDILKAALANPNSHTRNVVFATIKTF